MNPNQAASGGGLPGAMRAIGVLAVIVVAVALLARSGGKT